MAYNTNTKLLLQFTEANGATRTSDKSSMFRWMGNIGAVSPVVVAGAGPNGENVLRCGDPYGTPQQAAIRAVQPTKANLFDTSIGGPMRFDFWFNQRNVDGNYQYVFGWGAQNDRLLRAYIDYTGLSMTVECSLWGGTTIATTTFAITAGWHHLRVYTDFSAMAVGLDGVQKYYNGSTSDTLTPVNQYTYPITLFDIGGFEGQHFCGDIAQFQYLQNDYSWTGGAYTVPTTPYDEADPPDTNYNPSTKLQLLFQSATPEDLSLYQHPVTFEGVASRVSGDGPFGNGTLHVGSPPDSGSVRVTAPETVLYDQYGVVMIDFWFWYDSSYLDGGYLFGMESPGTSLRLYSYGQSMTAEWYGNDGVDSAYIGGTFSHPQRDAWHPIRLVIGNSMLILAIDGVEHQRVNTPGLVFPDYTALTLLEFGRFYEPNYVVARFSDITIVEDDFSYYDGSSVNAGPYPVPQSPVTKATQPEPLTIGVTGGTYAYSYGAFGVGLPQFFAVPGQTLAYQTRVPGVKVFKSPSDHHLFGVHFACRFVADDLVPKWGGRDAGAGIANEFWDAPPIISSSATVALTGQEIAYSQGAIVAVNPTRVVALVGQPMAYVQGAPGVIVGGPISVNVIGQALPFVAGVVVAVNPTRVAGLVGASCTHGVGAVGASVQRAVAGQAVPLAQGAVGVDSVRAVSGQVVPFAQSAPEAGLAKALVGAGVTLSTGTPVFSWMADYDYNTLMLVKCNEANGATTVYSTGLVEYPGNCLNGSAVTSAHGVFGSNSVAVGNPGGTRDPYAFVEFPIGSSPDIYGMFLNSGPTVDKQFDVWFKPSTNNSHTVFSIELNLGWGIYLRSNMTSIEIGAHHFWNGSLGYATGAKTSNLNTWRHYRVLISGNTVRVGYNGAEVCSFTTAGYAWGGDPTAQPYAIDVVALRLGRPMSYWDTTPYDFLAAQGYIDSFVVTSGTVSWAGGAYTVPTYEPTDAPYSVVIEGVAASVVEDVTSTGTGEVRDAVLGVGDITLEDFIGSGQLVHDAHTAEGENVVDDVVGEGFVSLGVVWQAAGANTVDDMLAATTVGLTPITLARGACAMDAFTSTGEGGVGWVVGAGSNVTEALVSIGEGTVTAYAGHVGVGANTVTVVGAGAGVVPIAGTSSVVLADIASIGTITNEKFAVGANTVAVTSEGIAAAYIPAQGANTVEAVTSVGVGVGTFYGWGESETYVVSLGVGSVAIAGVGGNTVADVTAAPERWVPTTSGIYLHDDAAGFAAFNISSVMVLTI